MKIHIFLYTWKPPRYPGSLLVCMGFSVVVFVCFFGFFPLHTVSNLYTVINTQISSVPLSGVKLNPEKCYVIAGIQSEPKCIMIIVYNKNLNFSPKVWGEGKEERKTFQQSPFALIFNITWKMLTCKLSPWTNTCETASHLKYTFSIFSGAMYSPWASLNMCFFRSMIFNVPFCWHK